MIFENLEFLMKSLLKYGSDKPDLRNPLVINDITEIFSRDDVSFDIFKKLNGL